MAKSSAILKGVKKKSADFLLCLSCNFLPRWVLLSVAPPVSYWAANRSAPARRRLNARRSKLDSVERRLAIRHVLSCCSPSNFEFRVKMGTKVFLVILFAFGNASILKIDEDFKYQRISVEVSDKVPRHLCQNTLDRLEVRNSTVSCQVPKKCKIVWKSSFFKMATMRLVEWGIYILDW